MRTFKEFIAENPSLDENRLFGDVQRAVQMFKHMTGIQKFPVKPPSGPANLSNIATKGASKPAPSASSAPKYNMGSGTSTPKPPNKVGRSNLMRSIKANTSTRPSTSNVGKVGRAAAAGVALDAAFPRPAKGGLKDAPKVPTKPSQVKTGEKYYDYNTRVGSSQRPAQRLKVGPKIVGTGSTPKPAAPKSSSQSFDSAFSSARKSGAKEFEWKGKKYNTKLKGE